MTYGSHSNTKSSHLSKCPGCGGKKIKKSFLCKTCWAEGNKGSNHPMWKGGLYNECPKCGGRKMRESKVCKKCTLIFQDGRHIRENERQKIFRKTPEGKRHVRAMNLKKYGIIPEQYDAMKRKQGDVCAACGEKETAKNQFGLIPLAVDHDHNTGMVRGLLCMKCNRSLGMLRDSVDIIEKLLTYRKSFN